MKQDEAMESHSERTLKAYKRTWARFETWMQDRGSPALVPVDPDDVVAYLTHLHKQGRKHNTLVSVCYAIRHRHWEYDLPNPCASHAVDRTLKALRKKSSKPRQAEPLTLEHFKEIRKTACYRRDVGRGHRESQARAKQRGLIDIALIGVMRDAMLRRGEAAALMWSDIIKQKNGGGILCIARSKTDQEGNGSYQYLSPTTMKDLAKIKKYRGDDPFVFGMSSRHIQRRIQAACEAAGLVGCFAGHSPRVGMTVDLVRKGFSGPAIQQCGRWRDPRMVAHYSKQQLATQNAVAQFHEAMEAGG